MKSYTFVLNFGYVESSRLSYMPFTSLGKYKNAKEALVDLANFLKEMYLINNAPKPRKCCTENKAKDSAAEFCKKCGRSLQEEEFNPEHFQEWLVDMSHCDIDRFHGDFIEYDTTQRWQSEGLEGAPNQRFVYNAEWVLSAAIGHPHRDDQTFEKICQERTKEKRESFSYY